MKRLKRKSKKKREKKSRKFRFRHPEVSWNIFPNVFFLKANFSLVFIFCTQESFLFSYTQILLCGREGLKISIRIFSTFFWSSNFLCGKYRISHRYIVHAQNDWQFFYISRTKNRPFWNLYGKMIISPKTKCDPFSLSYKKEEENLTLLTQISLQNSI